MKKLTVLMLSLLMAISLFGCGKEETKVPELNKVNKDIHEEQLKSELVGKSKEDVNEIWGKADSFTSGPDGEIWILDDDKHIVIVYYNNDNTIKDVTITTNDF